MRKAAVHAAEPTGSQQADADGAADGGRSADRRGAASTLNDACGEIACADLARRRVEPPELVLGQSDPDLSVEDADRRRDRARFADALLRFESDRDSRAGREAVRDQRRLERDHAARLSNLVGDDDHGSAPNRATQRAAASTASFGPPTRKPAASASPAPVASTTSPSRAGNSTRSSPSTSTPRAPRLTTAVGASPYAAPTISHSASFAKITSGSSSSSCPRKRCGPYSRMRVHAERSTLTFAPFARASSAALSAAASIGAASRE